MDKPFFAISAHDSVLDRIMPEFAHGLFDQVGDFRALVGMHQFQKLLEMHLAAFRRQAENAVGFARPGNKVRFQIAFPVSDVGDALRFLQFALAFLKLLVDRREFFCPLIDPAFEFFL